MISSFREASSLPLPSLVQALPPDGRGRLKRTHTRPESAMSGQTGAANGRAGGHASGSARRKRALDRAPRVRVLSETPTTKRKRHQDAVETSEQDLSPPGVDTGLLTSVTTTVVTSEHHRRHATQPAVEAAVHRADVHSCSLRRSCHVAAGCQLGPEASERLCWSESAKIGQNY